ncbi:MAG: alanine racemase [Oscillospiraceae bacterium]|nr:alanine racemase [Oscillospiraceae bacterium]
MTDYRNTTLHVDYGVIKDNVRLFRERLSEAARVCAVVKANAYGHGDVAAAKAAVEGGASFLAVALAREGIRLREHDIAAPILILGSPEQSAAGGSVEEAVAYGLTQTVFHADHLFHIDKYAAEIGKVADVHIKVDTGMSRIGIPPHELHEFAELVASYSHIRLAGIFTHFAVSDELSAEDNTFTRGQFEAFMEAAEPIKRANPEIILHCCNSAAALRGIAGESFFPSALQDMARIGIAMYGAPPVPTALPLRQAMRWATRVTMVKDVYGGCSVSYGRTYKCDGDTRVATLPLGYADGYHRAMTGKAQVLIHGQRAPIIGRICMDQCMADVSHIEGVEIGDEAVLLGRQGDDEIRADEMGRWADTISYEVFCGVSSRVPRV